MVLLKLCYSEGGVDTFSYAMTLYIVILYIYTEL